MKIILILSSLLVAGCSGLGVNRIYSSGTSTLVEVRREVLLEPFDDKFFNNLGVHYKLYDKDSENSWQPTGWVGAGSKILVLSVCEYVTDSRGSWVGVKGRFVGGSNDGKVFIYTWTNYGGRGGDLGRAPWEPNSVPEFRKVEDVLR
jgi:hypothetical protein